MTDIDDYGESPAEYEAAQRAAEEPPDWYLEEEAERQHQRHRDEEHGGGECTCPFYEPPPCRIRYRMPRWWPGKGWRAGTPGGCETWRCKTPRAAWRAHQSSHTAPF